MSGKSGTPSSSEPAAGVTDPTTTSDPTIQNPDPSDPADPKDGDPADPSLVKPGEPAAKEGDPDPTPEPEPLTAEDLDFGEGVEVNEELRDRFLTVMNDREMSPKERAQALTSLQVDAAKQMAEASNQAFADQQKAWQDEVKSDPDLGGANLEKTLGGISRLVDRYGNEEFVQVMAATGAGNNRHVISFLSKIAADLNEGALATGTATTEKPDVASRLYPSMKG